jgi:hypothetical protein
MASSGMLRGVSLVRSDAAVHRLLVTANVPSSPILVTLMMKALSSSETSVLTRATWRSIPEDAIFHSHCRENLKSYIAYPKIGNIVIIRIFTPELDKKVLNFATIIYVGGTR